MNVHQLLSGAGPVDAVTNQARAYRRLFDAWNWGGGDHAASADPRVEREFRSLRHFDPAPDDLLLVHYSAWAPRLERVLALPQRKVLVSHNITPAQWFWDYEPTTAVHCAVGREQLPRFARAVDLALGVSQFNADELAAAGAPRTGVVPILFDAERLGEPGADDPPGPPRWLFVGRLVPHKRPDLLLRAFALHRGEHAPDARLTWVGEAISPPYLEQLRAMADRLAPGAVTFESFLSAEALAERWRAAHAFVCLSEHEGFCIPLLEAFHFGVPVVARAVGGIPEVAGDAALLLGPDDDVATVAEAAHLVTTDGELRAALRERGRRRLQAYAYDVTARELRAQLEGLTARSPVTPG